MTAVFNATQDADAASDTAFGSLTNIQADENKRWYLLDDNIMEITRVEIKDTNDRYVIVPKLVDAHKILKEDEY